MHPILDEYRVFLIGGPSHAGKSTLAQSLAAYLGWDYRSTDKLARHPGRPWQPSPKKVPQQVTEHYLSLSVTNLVADVLRHYTDNVGPLIKDIVASHTSNTSTQRLVMEGSAILPTLVADSSFEKTVAIWLTASDSFLEQRIYATSQYEKKSAQDKATTDKFLARTLLYNERMMATINRLRLNSVDVENASDLNHLMTICLSSLQR